jgi:hypothetical protein
MVVILPAQTAKGRSARAAFLTRWLSSPVRAASVAAPQSPYLLGIDVYLSLIAGSPSSIQVRRTSESVVESLERITASPSVDFEPAANKMRYSSRFGASWLSGKVNPEEAHTATAPPR